jgi:hypothetical protein
VTEPTHTCWWCLASGPIPWSTDEDDERLYEVEQDSQGWWFHPSCRIEYARVTRMRLRRDVK